MPPTPCWLSCRSAWSACASMSGRASLLPRRAWRARAALGDLRGANACAGSGGRRGCCGGRLRRRRRPRHGLQALERRLHVGRAGPHARLCRNARLPQVWPRPAGSPLAPCAPRSRACCGVQVARLATPLRTDLQRPAHPRTRVCLEACLPQVCRALWAVLRHPAR